MNRLFATITLVIIAVVALVAAVPPTGNETIIAIRALALDAAVSHHGNLLVQESQVDVVITANRFERYLRQGYSR